MDENYYKFWADFFQQAAEGRARFDMMRKMMESSMGGGAGDFFELFRKWFASPQAAGGGVDAWENALSEFTRSINRFMSDFGVVPVSAYKDLEEKCNAFKQKVEEQEETIRRLRRMLAEKEAGMSSAGDQGTERPDQKPDWLNEMLKAQQQQFQKWTEMFMPAAAPESSSSEE